MLRYGVICALEELAADYPVTLRGGLPVVLDEAARCGFEAVELHIRNPLQYESEEFLAAAKTRGLAYAGISTGLEYMLGGLSLISDDANVRKAAVRRLKEHVSFADAIGAPSVCVGSMRSNIPDPERSGLCKGWLAEGLAEAADFAAPKGIIICIEAINHTWANYLCSVPETLEYIRGVGHPSLKIHIDTYQMSFEDPDLREAIISCEGMLGHVHFSDDNRGVPGAGSIDFSAAAKALRDISYDGFVVIESYGYKLGCPDVRISLDMLRDNEKNMLAPAWIPEV